MNNEANDSFLRKKINELDEIFPEELGDPSELWEDINARLEGKKKPKLWKILSVAASISLLALITIFLLVKKPADETVISYRTEIIQEPIAETEVVESMQEEKDAIEYVNEQCKVEKPVCHSEEFMELKQQLAEVDDKLQEIDQQKKLFGSDAALIKAQISAENQKAYLLKELIQILRS